jgi:hypothetical protein
MNERISPRTQSGPNKLQLSNRLTINKMAKPQFSREVSQIDDDAKSNMYSKFDQRQPSMGASPMMKIPYPVPLTASAKSYAESPSKRDPMAKKLPPAQQKKLNRVMKNYNQFLQLFDRDDQRKTRVIENLTIQMQELKENVSRIYKGEIKDPDQSLSMLRSCKNFDLDVSTASEMLKQFKFKFSVDGEDHENGHKHRGNHHGPHGPPKPTSEELLTYFMLFKLLDDQGDRPKATNQNVKHLIELEEKLKTQNAQIAQTLQGNQKVAFTLPQISSAPVSQPKSSFNEQVLEKLANIQARISQPELPRSKHRIQACQSEKAMVPQKRTFKTKYKQIHDQLMHGMNQNVWNLEKNLNNYAIRPKATPVYMPVPFR